MVRLSLAGSQSSNGKERIKPAFRTFLYPSAIHCCMRVMLRKEAFVPEKNLLEPFPTHGIRDGRDDLLSRVLKNEYKTTIRNGIARKGLTRPSKIPDMSTNAALSWGLELTKATDPRKS